MEESVLAELRQLLDQFHPAMASGAGAAELRRLADEVVQGGRVLGRFNRVRFLGLVELLHDDTRLMVARLIASRVSDSERPAAA